jgi:chondroitin 4-sulfotransferase 11
MLSLNGLWLRDDLSGQVIDIPSRGLQYFAIPKAACSSIMSALLPILDIRLPENEWAPEVFQTHKWDHLFERSRIVLNKRQALKIPGRRRFAVVRNPWDRLVSCFSEKIRADGDEENFQNGVSKILLPFGGFHAGMSFSEFVRRAASIPDRKAEPHWRSQFTFLVGRGGAIVVDRIIRFENLGSDLADVLGTSESDRLPHLLRSQRGEYRNYYDQYTRELVAKRWKRDIELFGYQF